MTKPLKLSDLAVGDYVSVPIHSQTAPAEKTDSSLEPRPAQKRALGIVRKILPGDSPLVEIDIGADVAIEGVAKSKTASVDKGGSVLEWHSLCDVRLVKSEKSLEPTPIVDTSSATGVEARDASPTPSSANRSLASAPQSQPATAKATDSSKVGQQEPSSPAKPQQQKSTPAPVLEQPSPDSGKELPASPTSNRYIVLPPTPETTPFSGIAWHLVGRPINAVVSWRQPEYSLLFIAFAVCLMFWDAIIVTIVDRAATEWFPALSADSRASLLQRLPFLVRTCCFLILLRNGYSVPKAEDRPKEKPAHEELARFTRRFGWLMVIAIFVLAGLALLRIVLPFSPTTANFVNLPQTTIFGRVWASLRGPSAGPDCALGFIAVMTVFGIVV